MFSSTSVKPASLSSFSSGGGGEELGSLQHERGEELKELSGSFCYSPSKILGNSWKRDQSRVSVLQCPFSCSSCGVGSARSSSVGFVRDRVGVVSLHSSIRSGTRGLSDGFMRHALGSCLDYDSPCFEARPDALDVDASSALVDQLTFNLEDALVGNSPEPYAKELLLSAQLRHRIFCDEFVVKAFCEAEKAHSVAILNR